MEFDMEKALIFTTVGTGLFFDDAYDKDNHWRYTKPERTYETCVITFNDFEPEPNTYDYLIRSKGLKWNLIPEAAKVIDWQKYDYIGCYDDDHTTDIQSLNEALAIARHYDFKLFSQSLSSPKPWPCQKHDPELFYSETDFIECSIPIFRKDMFEKLLPLLNDYRNEKSEWGLDKIFCHYLDTTAHVIHKNSAKHMRIDNSYYDHSDAFVAMNYLLSDFYPKYVKEKFGIEDYKYVESQKVLRTWKLPT
jgi:hypothetical protein